MTTLAELFGVKSDFVVDSETTAYVEAQFKNPNSTASKIRETVKTINAHKKALAYYTALLHEIRVYLEERYDEIKRITAREAAEAKVVPVDVLNAQAAVKKELEKKIQDLQSRLTDLNKKIDDVEKAIAEAEKLKQELVKKHTEEVNQKVAEVKQERHKAITELLDSSDEKQNINVEQLEQAVDKLIDEHNEKYASEASRERLLDIVAPQLTPEQARTLSEEEKRALARALDRSTVESSMSQRLNLNLAVDIYEILKAQNAAPRMGALKFNAKVTNMFTEFEEKMTMIKNLGPEIYFLVLENTINELKADLDQLQSEKDSVAKAADNLRKMLALSGPLLLTFIREYSTGRYNEQNSHLALNKAPAPAVNNSTEVPTSTFSNNTPK